jgi:hypothetical protein
MPTFISSESILPLPFSTKVKTHIRTDLPQDDSRTQENCLQSASAYLHISCAFLQAAKNPVCSSWDKGVDKDWEEYANAEGADAAEGDDDSEPSVYKGEAVLCLLFCRIEGPLYVVAGPPVVWVVLLVIVDHPRLIVVVYQQNIVGTEHAEPATFLLVLRVVLHGWRCSNRGINEFETTLY